MKRLLATTIAALLLLLAPAAHADTPEYDKTIDTLGVEGNLGLFTVVGGFSLSCPYSQVYIDLSGIGARSAYATMLAAKLTGNQLASFVYSKQTRAVIPNQELCYLITVIVQD